MSKELDGVQSNLESVPNPEGDVIAIIDTMSYSSLASFQSHASC